MKWAADDVITFLLILGAARFRLETLIVLDSFQVFILRESAGKKLEDLPGLCGTARKFGDAVFRFRSDSKARDVHDRKTQHLLDVRPCRGRQR